MPVSEATYESVALEDPEGCWELVFGRLRNKPGMTVEHNYVQGELYHWLSAQLDPKGHTLRCNTGRLRVEAGTLYVPDVFVIPRELESVRLREIPDRLEVYAEAMPLVVEVWSPLVDEAAVGDYDVEEKLREYQRRGDLEIWRIHPYERTLTTWRLQADGSYSETLYRDGVVQPAALPNVSIELTALFPE